MTLQMKALCEVPRNGLQLLPYYARITAALNRVFPEIGQGTAVKQCTDTWNLTLVQCRMTKSHPAVPQTLDLCNVLSRSCCIRGELTSCICRQL